MPTVIEIAWNIGSLAGILFLLVCGLFVIPHIIAVGKEHQEITKSRAITNGLLLGLSNSFIAVVGVNVAMQYFGQSPRMTPVVVFIVVYTCLFVWMLKNNPDATTNNTLALEQTSDYLTGEDESPSFEKLFRYKSLGEYSGSVTGFSLGLYLQPFHLLAA